MKKEMNSITKMSQEEFKSACIKTAAMLNIPVEKVIEEAEKRLNKAGVEVEKSDNTDTLTFNERYAALLKSKLNKDNV
ncbi:MULTISPECIES: hypothetical protein [Klebsiella]|uniref:hypothetical protein n=1 Tax=Klebsiella TaxID=570 RepID=UPI0015D47154|nr:MULTISPECIES: hypothetical protein [Klebsiella]EIY5130419.1 hypothetical protein [Klebsiella variicola]MBY5168948.1 hypothetical protein [Klebsiella variicola]MCJ1834281.1 hypothetical protein [Klebsiella variicola subsp. variicola]MCY3512447.1 hypothetical protein [Klebsiella michiganensis]GKM21844.1 hypothetical protein NUKP65_43530 [Klebsiella variicola]